MTEKHHRNLVETAVSGRHLHGIKFPDMENRQFWEGLPSDYRRELISEGEEALAQEWPALYLSDYMEFSRTGNRTHYEDRYFLRRRMLDALVLAEAAENRGRFLGKAVDGLWLLLEETSWCLPAHNSYIRDTKQFPVPRDSAPVIDLFAAETAATVGLAEAILRPALRKISPFLCEYADTELYRRIFRPYLSYHFWWMGDGHSKMLNWTPWITGNVLLAALTRPDAQRTGAGPDGPDQPVPRTEAFHAADEEQRPAESDRFARMEALHAADEEQRPAEPDRFPRMMPATGAIPPAGLTSKEKDQLLSQAALSLDYFLDEYADDGCCDEGAQYFSHAGLMLYTALHLLDAGLNDPAGIRTAEQTELIRNMAAYIVHVHVRGPYYINYADCSPLAGARTAGEYCYGRDAGVPSLVLLAAEDFRRQSLREKTLPEEISLYQRLRQAACAKAMLQEDRTDRKENATLPGAEEEESRKDCGPAEKTGDVFYPSTGLMVARDAQLVLACKAGDNGDSHNHNDVGSVILYRDGKPFLIDLGVETYTAKTFSADRYSIWTMQSQYHNLPTFVLPDGTLVMQKDGEAYAADKVQWSLTEEGAFMRMDLAGAYPENRRIFSAAGKDGRQKENGAPGQTAPPVYLYERKVELCKGKSVRMEDTAALAPGVGFILSLMTCERPEPVTSQVSDRITLKVGSLGEILLEEAADCRIEEIPVTDPRLAEMWQHSVYRILVTPLENRLRITIPE